MKIIHTFNDILLTKENPLVLCDIDDTILKYKYDFVDFFKKNVLISQGASHEELINYANDDYYIYRILNDPFHTDQDGFNSLLNKIKELNGEIMFITSRSKGTIDMTKRHFKRLNIPYNKKNIHYLSNLTKKGEFISKHIDVKGRGEILFIDNLTNNITNVELFNPSISCYKFVYKK